MTSSPIILMLFIIFTVTSIKGQERAPHGIAFQTPLAISPEAYNFFHPDGSAGTPPCASSSQCSNSNLPVAATVEDSAPERDYTSTTQPSAGGKKSGGTASGIATIAIGVLSVVMVGIGVYQLVIIRRKKGAARAAEDANRFKI